MPFVLSWQIPPERIYRFLFNRPRGLIVDSYQFAWNEIIVVIDLTLNSPFTQLPQFSMKR